MVGVDPSGVDAGVATGVDRNLGVNVFYRQRSWVRPRSAKGWWSIHVDVGNPTDEIVKGSTPSGSK
jgi:hypothetical protein